MSASADIVNFQMSAPFLVWGGALFKLGVLIKFFSCEEGHSFEAGVHLGWGALSENYRS